MNCVDCEWLEKINDDEYKCCDSRSPLHEATLTRKNIEVCRCDFIHIKKDEGEKIEEVI